LWALEQLPPQEKPQPESKPLPLQPGSTVEEVLAPREKKSFQVTLTAGEYAEIEIRPKGVLSLSVELRTGEGEEELEANTGFGRVAVPVLASKEGTHLLSIQRVDKSGGEGPFDVRYSTPRAILPDDETRVAAVRAFGQGEKLYGDRSAPVSRERLLHYQKSLALWQQLGDKQQETLSLMRIGQVYGYLYDNQAAIDYLERALSASQALGLTEAEAAISMSLGFTYHNHSDKQKALEHFRHALVLSRKIQHQHAEAIALMKLGELDDSVDALEYFRQALNLFRGLDERVGEAYMLDELGEAYLSRGQQQEGMESLRQALEVEQRFSDHDLEPIILVHLAMGYAMQADLRKALDYYSQALPLERAEGDTLNEGETLLQIGSMYLSLGELDKALEYSQRALAALQGVQSRGSEAAGLVQMGRVYSELGDTQKALTHFERALSLYRAVSDPLNQADALSAFGDGYLKQGNFRAALESYQQALTLCRSAPREEWPHLGAFHGEADLLRSIGSVQISLKKTEDALESLHRALEVLPTTGHSPEDEAAILYELARAERAANHLPEALGRVNAAVDLTERTRGTVAGADLRASYLARVRDRYELLIALLMQLDRQHPGEGFDAKGLEAGERARARGLLDLLNESHAEIRQGADPALLDREHSLQAQLSFKVAYRIHLLSKNHTVQQASDLEKEIGDLTSAYEETEAQIRARSPHYASLTQPQALTLSEIQRLLDPDTTLLEYSLGTDESFLWVVSANTLKSYPLPKRAEIETLARRAYEEMSVNNPAGGQSFTVALGRMLLGPAKELPAAKRVAVVADGALEYISFAALRTSPRAAPLVAAHEFVLLPSASTLALLRKEMEGRTPPPKQVAVLADPVFSGNDPRVAGGTRGPASFPRAGSALERSQKPQSLPEVERSAKETGLLTLDRLPASRREAQTIVALAGRNLSLQALDFDASRETATSANLAQYQTIHFASHTLLNSRHPELSGIVLSLVDKQGRQKEGFLQAHEIFNLKLNADLVVLSACRTALGKEVRGEGLVGLTRAFMYAGAPRVVASLWKVPDQATAELMRHFYRAMLTKGLSPSAALRASQLAMRRDQRWSAPYYWAGFVLQGEWK
jgi:CHAT domain-containing protein/Tfp pilus assembly protein PilF